MAFENTWVKDLSVYGVVHPANNLFKSDSQRVAFSLCVSLSV